MKKKSLFTLLFSSWILGVTLICIFPPIPDQPSSDTNSSYLGQDSVPEINQRNSSQLCVFQLDFGPDLKDFLADFLYNQNLEFSKRVNSLIPITQISTLFDTWILFKAFFETW